MAKASLTPVLLHGVIGADHGAALPSADLQLVTFRDIAAVVRPFASTQAPSRESLLEPPEMEAHQAVIAGLHRQMAVLPAPAAVVARDRASVLRWLEVHHVAFCEALTFVDDRSGARVHVTRTPAAASSGGPLDVPPLDLDATALDLFRALRRHAVASTIVRHSDTEADRASAAFLVETERWGAFVDAVAAEDRRHDGVQLEVTGPWPPYDFVKMQFGG
jgi:hypothetical protein